MGRDNKVPGTFRLDGIPPSPRGVPQIEVTFVIDANGILNVFAKDRGTSTEQTITITGSSTLDKSDVERMIRDAEIHAAEDESRKAVVETRNSAESLVYQVEKQLQERSDKVPGEMKANLEAKLLTLKGALAQTNPDPDNLRNICKDLQEEMGRIEQAANATTAGAG